MAEITLISSALASIKHATDIVRLLRESNTSLEHAEQKLKLAELIESLAETRVQLANIQMLLLEKDQKIKELEEAFQSKDSLIKVRDAYYETDQDGNAAGGPHCMYCWEANHKKYHLYVSNKRHGVEICPNCKTEYWMEEEREKRAIFRVQ